MPRQYQGATDVAIPIAEIMEEVSGWADEITDAIAKEAGSPRSANMVLLGAAASVLGMLDPDKLRDGIRSVFMRKGQEIVDANIKAFDAGFASAVKR